MNAPDLALARAGEGARSTGAPPADPLLAAPWSRLDDAALLAHWRRPRPVHVELVVDRDECPPGRLDALMSGRWEFNGETHALGAEPPWLDNPSADVEWHILLHKFYYAPALGRAFLDTGDERYARRWAALLDGWIGTVPPGFIAADVTGRRVQNWIYSLAAFADARAARTAPLDPALFRRLLHSLHEQVEFLCEHLTPKRNHRTLELYAIFLAGVALPELARAAHWRQFALRETLANLQADLLPDGVHCELSTDYHHLALRNWLNVRTLAARHGLAVPAAMDARLRDALHFSLHVHKPDGLVPSLSDGDVRCWRELLERGAALYDLDTLRWGATGGREGTPPADRVAHFPDAGYTVLRSAWGDDPGSHARAQYLVFDTGPLGEGNHGHFDSLSFELAAHGRSLVVDPGRYTYSEAGDVNWRVHFRHTAAHNTVCVDGRPQTRYEPRPVKGPSRHATGQWRHRISGAAPTAALVERVHADGMDLLRGRSASAACDVVHERTIVFVDGLYWIVADALRAATPHAYRLNFQLAAAAQGATSLQTGGTWRLASPGLAMWGAEPDGQRASLQPGWVSARYGHKDAAPRVVVDADGSEVTFDTVLWPWQDEPPPVTFARRLVHADDGRTGDAIELRFAIDGEPCVDTWWQARDEPAGVWQVAGLRLAGRWLHLRQRPDGQVLRWRSHAGAELR